MKQVIRKTDIAIIGLSGRFPKSENVAEFWNNLCQGKELLHFFNEKELRSLGMDEDEYRSPNFVGVRGCINRPGSFDYTFFGYSEHEAALMDPQIRILHEETWSALEDAGYNPLSFPGKVGLYLAASDNMNWRVFAEVSKNENVNPFFLNQISNKDFASTLISYKLNLRGPSYYVDTACSSSLVAVHIACRTLLARECSIALAGGASISSLKKKGYFYEEVSKDSKDGHCRPFDEKSSGTVSGEGVGIVVLKRLEDALQDRDQIYAVIRSSAVNNDGSQKIGYTAPSVKGQSDCIKLSHKLSDINPASISYIETHGTATKLGDAIEIEALNRAFGNNSTFSCAIGSVKSNIGHLDAAAGVAGLIKTALAIKYRKIPPTLHFSEPSSEINFKAGPFYVNSGLTEWKSPEEEPLRAGVSSFGIGGTNAHVVLEEPPRVISSSANRPFYLFTISGKTPNALRRNAEKLRAYLTSTKYENLLDISFTLNIGRVTFPYRKYLVVGNQDEAVSGLSDLELDENVKSTIKDTRKKIVFMFPGQGAQHLNMCADLYRYEKTFRDEVDNCFHIVQSHFCKDLKSIVFSEYDKRINDLEFAIPLLFIFEYSLARLIISWGISPDVMIGHSNGEYVAACLAGVFTLEDAIRVVVKRSELMQQLPPGKMLNLSISRDELMPWLGEYPEISIAAVNSPTSCVVSGSSEIIDSFHEKMDKAGYTAKLVRSSHAAHSSVMKAIIEDFSVELNDIKLRMPTIPVISCMTDSNTIATTEYWLQHLLRTVNFNGAISEIMKDDNVIFVEIGPGKSLSSFVGSNSSKQKGHCLVNLLGHQKDKTSELKNVLAGIGKLWQHGVTPKWEAVYENERPRRTSVPTYSFEKVDHVSNVDSYELTRGMVREKESMGSEASQLFYVPFWETSTAFKNIKSSRKYLNLIFGGKTCCVGRALEEKYRSLGEDVIYVELSNTFAKVDDRSFKVGTSEFDFIKLFTSIQSSALELRIVYTWDLGSLLSDNFEDVYLKNQIDLGYYALLDISRAANKTCPKKKIELTCITTNLQKVMEADEVAPGKATILAALKVIPKEYHFIKCRNIDIVLDEVEPRLIRKLFDEISDTFEYDLVAFRQHTRFLRVIKPITLTPDGDYDPIVSGSSYLITGGLGGIGLSIAKGISKRIGKINLLLLGRKNMPDRQDWPAWLAANDKEDPTSIAIYEILKIEENGCEVFYTSLDIADRNELRKAVEMFERKFGTIRGVIHSAGLGDFAGVIHRRTKEEDEKIFRSKIYGTVALSEVMKERKLDFFVMHSSLASILAPFGQVGYVAANAFMDSFAEYKSSKGSNAISIGWNAWHEVGIAARVAKEKDKEISKDNISQEEGLDILFKSLKSRLPLIYISKLGPNWYLRAKQDSSSVEDTFELHSIKLSSFEEKSTIVSTDESLLGIWRDFFGRSDFEKDADFFELGGDSLKAMTLLKRIQKFYGVEISVSDFYAKSNVKDLAREIEAASRIKDIHVMAAGGKIVKI